MNMKIWTPILVFFFLENVKETTTIGTMKFFSAFLIVSLQIVMLTPDILLTRSEHLSFIWLIGIYFRVLQIFANREIFFEKTYFACFKFRDCGLLKIFACIKFRDSLNWVFSESGNLKKERLVLLETQRFLCTNTNKIQKNASNKSISFKPTKFYCLSFLKIFQPI